MEDRGVHVQRQRVRVALYRVDGLNVRARLSHIIQRRHYVVPGPNSLWHVDGNHKLIWWKFVVHGGIDGFSRLFVYLGCVTNIPASPFRPRMENVEVVRAMITRQRTGRGSHIYWELNPQPED